MKNKFYTDWDLERIKSSRRNDDYRSPFQIDRDRIIHSSEFRRLQGKTQVFLPGEYDFYRTRLTHSIEVAQIGRSICNYLRSSCADCLSDEFYVDPDLVESICLAHDLGHPPFGHAGERTINKLMNAYGGFEGNAQTLRLITETFYRSEDSRRGMNPTRAFLDGILKYKALFKNFKNPENHFIYNDQRKYIEFVFGKKGYSRDFSTPKELNKFRSIECQIMDWADDTAYAVNDLVDSISGGFITIAKLVQWQKQNNLSDNQSEIVNEMIEWIKSGKFKPKFGIQIGDFVKACSLRKRKTFLDNLTNRYSLELKISKNVFEKAELYKRISVELVFRSPQLHQMEYKGKYMIGKMFDLFKENYIDSTGKMKLLPEFTDRIIRGEKNKVQRARLVCDQIAGMTDSYAMRTYRRLFDPDYSSIADLV
ncbi:MAG TPA: dNTP triphosphohydrolase [Melioribacteraceae bacterium]|nr:dNTP triphosphohydrolase [Melioribacteraceae bacterium]